MFLALDFKISGPAHGVLVQEAVNFLAKESIAPVRTVCLFTLLSLRLAVLGNLGPF